MALTQISADGIKDGQVKTADILDDNVTTAKIADDAVTDAKLANSINAAISANTAKTTNATHTGEVTGSGALTIADDVVDEANLKVSNSPTNGYFLSAQSGNTGGLTWAAAPSTVGGATGFDLNDNVKARFGTGNDLQIYHNGSTSLIEDSVGDFRLRSDALKLQAAGGANYVHCTSGGAVQIYYDNAKKFETTSAGCLLGDNSKIQLGAGPDLEIYSDGTNSFVQCPATGNNLTVESDNHLYLKVADSDDAVKCVAGGAVELYYDNTKKLETTAAGIWVNGALKGDSLELSDNKKIILGTGDDLELFHDGSHSVIQEVGTGGLKLVTDHSLQVRSTNKDTGEYMIQAIPDGDVELYYNGNEKLATIDTGVNITGGIRLGGNNAANELDDYEEGDWTITFPNSSGAAQNSSGHTKGRYVKIGSLVYVHFFIYFGSSGTVPANNANVFKMSLPFSSPANHTNSYSRHTFTVMHQEIKMDNSREQIVGYLTHSDNDMRLYECGDDLLWQSMTNAGMNRTAMMMYISGCFSTV